MAILLNICSLLKIDFSLTCFKEILSSLTAPVIVLFLGGFFIVIAATKYKLETRHQPGQSSVKTHWQ